MSPDHALRWLLRTASTLALVAGVTTGAALETGCAVRTLDEDTTGNPNGTPEERPVCDELCEHFETCEFGGAPECASQCEQQRAELSRFGEECLEAFDSYAGCFLDLSCEQLNGPGLNMCLDEIYALAECMSSGPEPRPGPGSGPGGPTQPAPG